MYPISHHCHSNMVDSHGTHGRWFVKTSSDCKAPAVRSMIMNTVVNRAVRPRYTPKKKKKKKKKDLWDSLRPVRFPCPSPAQSPSATNKPCTLPTLLDLKPFLCSNSEWGGGLLLQHNLEKKDMCEEAFLCGSHLRERHTQQAPKESFSYLLFYRLIALASPASQERWTEVSLLYWSAAVCSRAKSLSTTTDVLIRSQFEREKLSDTTDKRKRKRDRTTATQDRKQRLQTLGKQNCNAKKWGIPEMGSEIYTYPNKRTTRKKEREREKGRHVHKTAPVVKLARKRGRSKKERAREHGRNVHKTAPIIKLARKRGKRREGGWVSGRR